MLEWKSCDGRAKGTKGCIIASPINGRNPLFTLRPRLPYSTVLL